MKEKFAEINLNLTNPDQFIKNHNVLTGGRMFKRNLIKDLKQSKRFSTKEIESFKKMHITALLNIWNSLKNPNKEDNLNENRAIRK